MNLPNLLASAFSDFATKYLAYIIVAIMVIIFIIIIVIAVKRRKTPEVYTSDDIDRSVDEAAKKKAAERAELENQKEQLSKEQPKAEKAKAEPKTEPTVEKKSEQPKAEETPKAESKPAESSEEDIGEELTFEADDIDEPEQKEAPKRKISYRILYDKETKTWEVRKDQAKRVIRRVKTKKEALEIAQELCQKQELNLVVHKKDGKFQKRR